MASTFWLAAHLLTGWVITAEHDSGLTPRGNATPVAVHGQAAFALSWRVPLVRQGMYRTVLESFGQPAISTRHGLILAGTGEGNVLALSAVDGGEVWRYHHGVAFETGAAVAEIAPGEEILLVCSRDGTLLAIDVKAGHVRWQQTIDGDMRAAPRVAGRRLVVTTAANRVMALDLQTGSILWSAGRGPSSALTVEGHARPAIDGNRVYAAFSDGYVSAVDLEHGSTVWSRPLSLKGGGSFVDADGDPAVVGGRLFVSSYSDGVYALDTRDGQTLWNTPAGSITSLAFTRDLVLAGSASGALWGLRQSDGLKAFCTRVVDGPISRLAVQNGLVAFSAGPNGLVAVQAHDGFPVQATALGGTSAGDPVWEDNILAFITGSGTLFAWTVVPQRGGPW